MELEEAITNLRRKYKCVLINITIDSSARIYMYNDEKDDKGIVRMIVCLKIKDLANVVYSDETATIIDDPLTASEKNKTPGNYVYGTSEAIKKFKEKRGK